MLHLSAWVLPVYALTSGIYGWMTGGKFKNTTFIYSVSGYAISFLIHPNFPNNIFYSYLNGILVPWYAISGGVLELGAEFFPLTTRDILFRYPAIPAILVFLGITRYLLPVHTVRNTGHWMLASLIFGIFALFSVRNVTHLYPILIIFAALAASDFGSAMKTQEAEIRDRIKSVIIPAAVLVFIAAGWITINYLNLMFVSDTVYSRHFENMANVIRSRIPLGSRIFHSNWSDSQYLIGMAPEYEYYVTLDPIYMYSYNRFLYGEYRDISFGKTKDPYSLLINDFGTYYGYAGKNYFNSLIGQIRGDKRFEIIAEDSLGILFRLIPEKSADAGN